MKMSHVHCRVRDLQGAAHWFEQVWQVTPVFQTTNGWSACRLESLA
jgi:hypothetical protein